MLLPFCCGTYDIERRVRASPEIELLGGLCNEHREAADSRASGGARFSQETCLARIVNEVVGDARASELRASRGCLVLTLAARAERRCVDDKVEAVEARAI